MKLAGIIRHLDKVGRITIPKEYRDSLKIVEGGAVEIALRDNEVIIRRHEKFNLFKNAQTFASMLGYQLNRKVAITNTEQVIAISKEAADGYSRPLTYDPANGESKLFDCRFKLCKDADRNLKWIAIYYDSEIIGYVIIFDGIGVDTSLVIPAIDCMINVGGG